MVYAFSLPRTQSLGVYSFISIGREFVIADPGRTGRVSVDDFTSIITEHTSIDRDALAAIVDHYCGRYEECLAAVRVSTSRLSYQSSLTAYGIYIL